MQDKKVEAGFAMNVSSAGLAMRTTITDGGIQTVLAHGTALDTTVSTGGTMYVSSGGKTTGRMIFDSSAHVTVDIGGFVDFNISNLVPTNTALVNDLSVIQGEPLYSLPVSPDMASGIYRLADGATDFNRMIYVYGQDGLPSNMLMLSQRAYIGGVNYLLGKTGSHLTVSVINTRTETPEYFNGRFSGSGGSIFAAQYDDSVLFYAAGTGWGAPLSLDSGWEALGAGDFNLDGKDDVLRMNADGYVVGEMSNGNGTFSPQVLNLLAAGWSIGGIGDFNGNGKSDVLVANPTGASDTVGLIGYWEGGTTWTLIDGYSSNDWWVAGTGNFNGDGKCDILWQNSFISNVDNLAYNQYSIMLVYSNSTAWTQSFGTTDPGDLNFLCSGDFDGDDTTDIAMINGSGEVGIWCIINGGVASGTVLNSNNGIDTSIWSFAGVGDFNGDGTDDIAWCNPVSGQSQYWQISNMAITSTQTIATIA